MKYVPLQSSWLRPSHGPWLIFGRFLATCSADTTVKIWSISSNYDFKLEKVLQGHQRWVWDCAFSADSAYLVTGEVFVDPKSTWGFLLTSVSASSDHTARLWEMASGDTVRQYNGHHKGVVLHFLPAMQSLTECMC